VVLEAGGSHCKAQAFSGESGSLFVLVIALRLHFAAYQPAPLSVLFAILTSAFGTRVSYRSSGRIGFARMLEHCARSQSMELTFDCSSSILQQISTPLSSKGLDTDTKLLCAFKLVTLFGSMAHLSLESSMT